MRIRTLIDVPPKARPGELITIRATISHPMETGYRRDSGGTLLARDIIRTFSCRFGDKTFFRSDLFPAVSANPYLSFHYRAQVSGELTFIWSGDRGFEHRERVALIVE
jgi:sulfur-oxidizing protein SoxZ